jgi:hydroxymethylbilane synthase
MWQARHTASLLRQAWPGLTVELIPITSSGDIDLSTPLYGMGNVGVFAREIHLAVLEGRADAAVHSCKDLPTTPPEGIAPPVLLARHDVRDALVGAPSIAALPAGARVGSSSLRRRSQLAALRSDLRFVDLRGNVGTRLAKIAAGEADATLLAAAGLMRLNMMRQVGAVGLDPLCELVPAPAQGALAIDHRHADQRSAHLLAPLRDHCTSVAVTIERAVLAGLRGGCSLPFGCLVRRRGTGWHLRGRLARDDGSLIELDLSGPATGLAARALSELAQA